jgi:GNAT superfamily N-acetyltransferase/FKBP-type peptidyl-prolyl cis-trans isomerase
MEQLTDTVDLSEFSRFKEAQAQAELRQLDPADNEKYDEPDSVYAERRLHYLKQGLNQQDNQEVPDLTLNPEISSAIAANKDIQKYEEEYHAQNAFDKIERGENLTKEEFRIYWNHVGELRKTYGGEMSLTNLLVGAKDMFADAFIKLGEGVAETWNNNDWDKVLPSIAEGGARNLRGLAGGIWYSKNKDSWSYAVKSFLTGADTFEESWANFQAAQEFSTQTNKYLKGEDGLLFDSRWTNKHLVESAEVLADPALLLGLISGGSTAIGAITAKLGMSASRVVRAIAKSMAVTTKAVHFVTGAPLKLAGYPLWLGGAAAVKGITLGIEATAKVASVLTGGALETAAVSKGLKAIGLGSAAFGADPFSRKFASIYGLGLVAEGIGAGAVRAGGILGSTGTTLLAEQIAADATLPTLTRRFAALATKVDNFLPIPSLTANALRGSMVGGSYMALLGAYEDGTRGAYNGFSAGLGLGAAGGLVGATGAKIANLNGKVYTYNVYDHMMRGLKITDPQQHKDIEAWVAKHDKAGQEVRGYVIGVPNKIGPNSKIRYFNAVDYAKFVHNPDPNVTAAENAAMARTQGAAKTENGINVIGINTAHPVSASTGVTPVHEFFHNVMWEHGYKRGMINRLTYHLLGMNIGGQELVKSPVDIEEVDGFIKVYAKKLLGNNMLVNSEWYKDVQAGVIEYRKTGKVTEGLRRGVEEFGANFFQEWIKGKPMDYLFRSGDLGMTRNAYYGVRAALGEAIRYGLNSMGKDLNEAGYRFKEINALLNKGATGRNPRATIGSGMRMPDGKLVRDPVMDRIMQDVVKNTWNPQENRSIDTLAGEPLRIWAGLTGNERRIYKDKSGVWKFKDVKQFAKEEGQRGVLVFQTLEGLRTSGIDIGAEITDVNGVKRIDGHLSVEAIKALKDKNLINTIEALQMTGIQLAVERGSDVTSYEPNGLRFTYHGISQEVELADGSVVRNRRPWSDVPITDRNVIPYRIEYVLTTKDSNGKKIDPEFQMMMTGIDNDALQSRLLNSMSNQIRMKDGTVVTIGSLLGPTWAQARGAVKKYLANLSSDNAKPSAQLFGGGVRGAAIRDALYSIIGTVPTSDTSFANRPNRSLQANKRGPNFVFSTYRLDLMYNLEETSQRLTFNEDLAYPRAKMNYQPTDDVLNNPDVIRDSVKVYDKNRPTLKDASGKPVLKGDKEVKVTSELALKDGTQIFETKAGVIVRSPLLRNELFFKAEKIYGEEGKPTLDEVGDPVMTNPWDAANDYLRIQSAFSDAINETDLSAGYGIVEHNGKYIIVEQPRRSSDRFIVNPKVFDNAEDAQFAARNIYKADKTHIKIVAKDSPLLTVDKEGNLIDATDEHRNYASKKLRDIMVFEALNPETIPVDVEMVNGLPVVVETIVKRKNGTAKQYSLKIKTTPYDLLKESGLSSDTKANDPVAYRQAVDKYALKMFEDLRSQFSDADVASAIDWYKTTRRKIRQLYGPSSDLFFELLGATSPNEGPEANWAYAVEAMERYVAGEYDVHLLKAAQRRDAILTSIEDGSFRTGFEAQLAFTSTQKYFEGMRTRAAKKGKPFSYTQEDINMEAEKRLRIFQAKKQEALELITRGKLNRGEKGKADIARLIKLVSENKIDKDAGIMQILDSLMQKEGLKSFYLTKKALLDEANKQLKEPIKELAETLKRPSKNESRLGELVNYGMHNEGIAQCLLGMYERMNYGPKTYNYQLNLKGAGTRATIDLWAARSMRRVIMGTNGNNRWRIAPSAEAPVQSGSKYLESLSNFDDANITSPEGRKIDLFTKVNEAEGDFFYAQDVFQRTAELVRENYGNDKILSLIEPHEIQAAMWFREKKLWTKKQWTSGAGASLSSYETRAKEATGQEAPTGADDYRAFDKFKRISISASMSTPTTNRDSNVGPTSTGVIGDINSTVASKEAKSRAMKALGPALKSGVFSPTQGMYAGNFVGDDFFSGTEAAMGIDFAVHGDAARLDNAYVEALKLGINIGMSGQQDTVVVHEQVTSAHPNARDTYTLHLDRKYDNDSQELTALITQLQKTGKFAGMTAEPHMEKIAGKVKVTGLVFHHIPEFEALYGGAKYETDAQVQAARREFKKNAELTLYQMGWQGRDTLYPDGSTHYERVRSQDKINISRENNVDLSKMIADVTHGFINSTVITHNEYSNVDPVYLSRRNLTALQHIQRVFNNNERAKQTRQQVAEQGEYAKPRQSKDTPIQATSEQVSATDQSGIERREVSDSQPVAIQTDGTLNRPEEAQVYVEKSKKVFDSSKIRNHTSLMTVGENADYIISRGVTEGKADNKVRVVHKNDSFPMYFDTEASALEYVTRRLKGEVGAPRNKDSSYDYYVRGTGVVSGVRRAAIARNFGETDAQYESRVAQETGKPSDVYGEMTSGALRADDPFFGFFQQNLTSEPAIGSLGEKVYVEAAGENGTRTLYQPSEGGPLLNAAEHAKWREAVKSGDLTTAQQIVNTVLENNGYSTQRPYFHGNAKQSIGEPRNWRAAGISPRLYLASTQRLAHSFGITDSALRRNNDEGVVLHRIALAKDIKLFDAGNDGDITAIRQKLKDPMYVRNTAMRTQAAINAFMLNMRPVGVEELTPRERMIKAEYELLNETVTSYLKDWRKAERDFVEEIRRMNQNGLDNKVLNYGAFENGILAIAIKDSGYDGYIEGEFSGDSHPSIAVINPEKVKSMEPVTFADKESAAAKKPIDISQRGDSRRTGVDYQPSDISPEQDAAYAKLVAAGDTEGAKKMVDDLAVQRGFAGPYYHGTSAPYDIKEFKSRPDAGVAVHITPKMSLSEDFASDSTVDWGNEAKRKVYSLKAKTDNLFDPQNKKHTDKLLAKMIRNGVPEKEARKAVRELRNEGFAYYETNLMNEDGTRSDNNFVQKAIQELGFDGYYEREMGINNPLVLNGKKVDGSDPFVNPRNIAMHRSNYVKMSDVATYDNNGELIPLSKRFDVSNADIRYQPSDEKLPSKEEWADIVPDINIPVIPELEAKGFIGLYAEKIKSKLGEMSITEDSEWTGLKDGKSLTVTLRQLTSNAGRYEEIGTVYANYYRDVSGNMISWIDSSTVRPAYQGQGFGSLLYSEIGTRLSRLGVTTINGDMVDKKQRPLKIRQKTFGKNSTTSTPDYDFNYGDIFRLNTTIEKNTKYQPSEGEPIRLSGKMKEIPIEGTSNVSPDSSDFKGKFIGKEAMGRPDVQEDYSLSFGKLSAKRYNWIPRGGTAPHSKDTHVVELKDMFTGKGIGYLRFDVKLDRARKGKKIMSNIVVDIEKEYQGKKLQHVLYSEAIERARIMGAETLFQSIENEQGLPLKSQTRVLGEKDSFVSDLDAMKTYYGNQEGFDAAKNPEYSIVFKRPDGTEDIKTGKGYNKYVYGSGNIHQDRRYQPNDGAVLRAKTYPNQESKKTTKNSPSIYIKNDDIWERYLK